MAENDEAMRRSLFALLLVASALPTVGGARAGLPIPLVRLTNVAILSQPVAMAARTGDEALYVVEKAGRIVAIRGGAIDPTPVLDISSEVSNGLEQGLLGLAFLPTGDFLYVNYTDTAGDTRVVEYAFSGGRAVTSSRRELLFVNQPFANHNGGTLAFGPDGYLYIGLGDGGSGGDPFNNAQRLSVLLGKHLRIDPRGAVPYRVPPDNPFVGVAGARPEIWAYGLRNPWKFSFDRLTGDLWTADVGQDTWEEVDYQSVLSGGGENYGWNRMEGNHPYRSGTEPGNHTPPVYEYRHGIGCSITGGYVYRGVRIPALQGAYLFGDFCAGRVWALTRVLDITIAQELGLLVPTIASFGQDNAGELYTLSLAGDVSRIDPILP